MKQTTIILSAVAFLAIGCGQTVSKQVETVETANVEIVTEQNSEEIENQTIDVITTIKFSDFTLTINRLSVWNEKEY